LGWRPLGQAGPRLRLDWRALALTRGTKSRRFSTPGRWCLSGTAFAAGADIGYGHHYLATSYTKPGSKPLVKGKLIMGDKSPKSVRKQASQKQAKATAEAQKKKQAADAKQVVGKK
jgi:hypothetical protein